MVVGSFVGSSNSRFVALLASANEPAAQPAAATVTSGPTATKYWRNAGSPREMARKKGRREPEPHACPPSCEAWKGHRIKPATAFNKPQDSCESDASDESQGTKHDGKGGIRTTAGSHQKSQINDRTSGDAGDRPSQSHPNSATDAPHPRLHAEPPITSGSCPPAFPRGASYFAWQSTWYCRDEQVGELTGSLRTGRCGALNCWRYVRQDPRDAVKNGIK